MVFPFWVDILPEAGGYLGRMATQENNDDRIALLQGTLDLLILKTLAPGTVPWAGRGALHSAPVGRSVFC